MFFSFLVSRRARRWVECLAECLSRVMSNTAVGAASGVGRVVRVIEAPARVPV
jgi:hypothetical protein